MRRTNRISHGLSSANLLIGLAYLAAPLTGQTWNQWSPVGAPPAARANHSAVLDISTKQMIIFGGGGGGSDFNDVWSLSFAGASQWFAVNPSGTPPHGRVGHSAVYDRANSKMIIFGGGLGNTSPCANDVWVLSNANSANGTPTWTQLNPTGGPPLPRIFHAAAYDPGSNRMIVFGGNNCFTAGAQFYNDVWVLTNANGLGGTPSWIQLSPSGGPPGARENFAAVYDAAANRMTIFGGAGSSPLYNDVWVLSNANGLGGTPTWTQLAPAGASIPGMAGHTGVYDQATSRLIIFGGGNSGGDFNGVWVLSYANGLGGVPAWTQLTPTGTLPAAREEHSAVYDPTANRMVVFGGVGPSETPMNDTWVLNNLGVVQPGMLVPITPCRLVDTRSNMPQPYGAASSTPLTWVGGSAHSIPATGLTAGSYNVGNPCVGLPAAEAYSANITVWPQTPVTTANKWLSVCPTGTATATCSATATVTWYEGGSAGSTAAIVANAAVIPVNAASSFDVYVTDSTWVIIDIMGYYPAIGDTNGNTILGVGALQNNAGQGNTATGDDALQANTTGKGNTATGYLALQYNTAGNYNTATGSYGLQSNLAGSNNVATGYGALQLNNGNNNTASGMNALSNNTSGGSNIAIGANAAGNVSGANSNNIHIGTIGASGDSGTIRIGGNPALGDAAGQTRFFAAGISGVTTGNSNAVPVLVDSNGQLGTMNSSRRFKEDIKDMGDVSLGLMQLRPVTFRYKEAYTDGTKPMQYGLIAEEVAEVYPDLIVHSADGKILTVKYQMLDSLLLNEVQRLQREVESLKKQLEGTSALEVRLAELERAAGNH